MMPHLLALNVNGMVKDGEKLGKKILPLGSGDLDLKLLKIIAESGYKGPIGILGHTNDDAEERLRDNLDGLDWLLPQLAGKPAGPKPKYRTTARPQAVREPLAVSPPPGPNLKVDDPKLKVTLISRSEDDAYMGVKLDGAGNLFVGGREKVFVFEPDGRGGFQPRRELLTFPPDSIIIGLEYRGDDLYVLASHALYLVKDGRVKREGLQPKRILWGVPLDYHVSFHCLAWGPEGDLYLNHGDPLLNYGDWSRPDHWGYWPLYAGPDGKKHHYTGQGAVLKVKPDGSDPKVIARGLRGPVGLCFDSKWNLFTNDNDHESRADQYAPMRLLHVTPHADFGWPRGWMASKSPDRADLLDSMNTSLGRGVPCDMTFYDEPAIPALRGQLLMCRWDRFAVTRYMLKPNGATFAAEEFVFSQGSNQCRPTGIAVDTSGRIFVTSHYLGGNVVTPHCVSDLTMIAPEGLKWEKKDESNYDLHDGNEVKRLTYADSWEVRRRFFHENVRRWNYTEFLKSGEDKTINEIFSRDLEQLSPELRTLALASFQPVARLRACTELARFGTFEEIEKVSKSSGVRTRQSGIIAAGIRLTVPAPDAPPPEGVKLSFPQKSAFFNPEIRFADAERPVDITARGRIGSYTMAQKWAAGKHTDEDEKLFALLLAALDDPDDLVKSQAAYYLGWLRDPRSEQKVIAVRLELRTKGLKDRPTLVVKEAWVSSRIADAAASQAIERGPVDLMQGSWQIVKDKNDTLPLPEGKGAAYALFRIQSRERQPALLANLGDVKVWHNGRAANPESDGSYVLDLQPGSNDILIRSGMKAPLVPTIRAKGLVSFGVPEKSDGATLAERLKAATGPAAIPAEILKIDWSAEAKKGNAENGRKLFGTLGCSKCHAIVADQAGGGAPSLAEAGKRFTPAHLVESILMPDRLVAEEFRATRIVTTDGQAFTGLIVKETPTEIEVLFPDTMRKTLKPADIESRKAVATSPMPAGVVKTVDELRDVLTYLLSENPAPP